MKRFLPHSCRRAASLAVATLLVAATSKAYSAAAAPASPVAAELSSVTGTAPSLRQPVLPGLEVLLRDSLHLVRGKRLGLITNQTAVTSTGESGIDLLARSPDFKLVALYAPEHGLRGGVGSGEWIASGRDRVTGIPVFSLYGKTQRPTAAMLRGVDVLLFDMQDIGARPYTYVWTMAMAMEAAAEHGIPFVVLDRPNPITGAMEGGVMQMEFRNAGQAITGYYPVPLRHGMTVGEIARYINTEYKIGTKLTVVPVTGWHANRWFDETGLPWINPSPNIRSLDAALVFSGFVMLETVNLTVGRGTDQPFFYVGAPWLNTPALLQRIRSYQLPGVEFDTARFVPRGTEWMQFRNQEVRAIHLRLTDRTAYRPVLTALVFLAEIRRLHPRDVGIGSMLQILGSRWAREALVRGDDPRDIVRRWDEELAEWSAIRERYRLYPAD
jgi:uncharacterized protein YbbC (DUF1343 family)